MPRPGRTALLAAGAALLGVTLATAIWRLRDPAGDAPRAGSVTPQILFDDFDGALRPHGWTVRTAAGEPGVPGARWAPASPAGGLLRLAASSDGTAAGTSQTLVCRGATARAGTSAARIRLRDEPAAGDAEDTATTAFGAFGRFTGARGEFSFAYAPRRLEVTAPDGATRTLRGSRAGWHVLLAQVGDGAIDYWIDGVRVATRRGRDHGGASAISLGLWLDRLAPGGPRRWAADVDWVFHEADVALSHPEVLASVASLRRVGIGFQDTVDDEPAGRVTPCSPG